VITTPFEIHKNGCKTRFGKPVLRDLKDITGVVVHSTGGGLRSAVNWFKSPDAKVSAPFIIGQDGTVMKALFQGHCLDVVMYHAGKSKGWAGKSCNHYMLGIEHAHIDNDKQDNGWPKAQTDALVELLRELKRVLPNLHYITRHRDITKLPNGKTRKVDPDDFFPINDIAARTGLVWWH
jgi:N-acetyl-anhydromuramyl-L-alanine amidase AmpD